MIVVFWHWDDQWALTDCGLYGPRLKFSSHYPETVPVRQNITSHCLSPRWAMSFERLWWKEGEKGRLLLASPMIICKRWDQGRVGFLLLRVVWCFWCWCCWCWSWCCWSNKAVLKLSAQLITVIHELEKLSSTISVIWFCFFTLFFCC